MMARNFVCSAALTLGLLVVGVNVTAMDVGAPTVQVADGTALDQHRAASARATKRAELRAALDRGHNHASQPSEGRTEIVLASPRRHEQRP